MRGWWELPVDVDRKGAVLLGKSVACDAHAARRIRVVTHAHRDHLWELSKSLKFCEKVVMTPATRETVEILWGKKLPQEKLLLLQYGEATNVGEARLRLHPADHIVGACQVELETEVGRMVYTGDFRLPGTPILQADFLVMEATYGNPSNRRPFEREIERLLLQLVQQELRNGPVYIFGYHGKLQETCKILSELRVPVLMPSKVYKIAKVCEKYGMKLGDYFLEGSLESQEIFRSREFVALHHMSDRGRFGADVTRVYLSGWEFRDPVKKLGRREYVVALSDHTDFDGLIQYVRESSPRLVITDNYRIGDAKTLAKEIKRRLGIEAFPRPYP